MGKVSGNWITGTHSGRACHHDDIYTKVNKKTGACYSVKLCNPNTSWTEKQTSQRTSFGTISRAISAWISTNKAESATNHTDFLKVKKQYDRQKKYATLRGMMYAKGMYTVDSEGNVTVDITARTSGAVAGTSASSSSASGSGSTSGSGTSGSGTSGSGGSSISQSDGSTDDGDDNI